MVRLLSAAAQRSFATEVVPPPGLAHDHPAAGSRCWTGKPPSPLGSGRARSPRRVLAMARDGLATAGESKAMSSASSPHRRSRQERCPPGWQYSATPSERTRRSEAGTRREACGRSAAPSCERLRDSPPRPRAALGLSRSDTGLTRTSRSIAPRDFVKPSIRVRTPSRCALRRGGRIVPVARTDEKAATSAEARCCPPQPVPNARPPRRGPTK